MKSPFKIPLSFFFALCSLFSSSFSQTNLVPNPSFENYSSCPTNQGQINLCTGWYSATTNTPDYFNTCNTASFGCPSNACGFQNTYFGNAYTGIYTYFAGNEREYLQIMLVDSLIAGKKYCVSFFVSPADNFKYGTTVSAFISSTPISSGNNFNLNYIPQINTPSNQINNPNLWTEVIGNYFAVGGEKYLTIGNFMNDATIDTILLQPDTSSLPTCCAYYYIEDVSVVECTDSVPVSLGINIPNIFTPNADGQNDVFRVIGLSDGDNVNIYNRWGTKIYEFAGRNDVWDGRTTSGNECEDGVYYYVIIKEENIYTGFIQLIK